MNRSANRIPPDKWKPVRVEKVNALYDLLASMPNGATVDEVTESLGISKATASRVVRDLRVTLGVDDTITVITEQPGGAAFPGIYKLIGTFGEGQAAIGKGIGEVETRAETLWYMTVPLAKASDGRTFEGRRAKFVEEQLRHMLAMLTLMHESEGGGDQPTLFS